MSAAARRRWPEAFERVLLALWVGGLWAVGLLVAPALFHLLDSRALAGDVAGALFARIHLMGAVSGLALIVLALIREGPRWLRGWRSWVLIAMLVVTAVFELVMAPAIAELRATAAMRIAGSETYAHFRMLHGASAVLYLLNCVLGLLLVAAGISGRRD